MITARSEVTARPPGRGSTLRWALGAAVVAAVIMAPVGISPAISVGVAGGLGVILLAAFRPKAFLVLAWLLIILSVPLENIVGSVFSYADEAMVALSVLAFTVRRLVTRGSLVWLPGLGWFVIFLGFGVLSSLANGVGAGTWGPAGLIAVKTVLFAFALAQLEWRQRDLQIGIKIGIGAILVLAATGAVNLVAPGPWAQLTTGRPPISYIGPLPALNGPFQHPAAFSRMNAVLGVSVLAYLLIVRRTARGVVLMALAGGLAFLTFQVKSIVSLLASFALVGVRFLRPVGIVAVICLLPVVAALAGPPIYALVGGDVQLYLLSQSARSYLIDGAIILASAHFPLGVGFGRYGSSTAATNYSPEYYRLGFDHIFGLGPLDGNFLNDNQWPAIVGETGYLGGLCFAIGLVIMVISLVRRISPDEPVLYRWLRATGIGWVIVLLVESVASPVFVSAPSYPFLFAAVGVVASLRRSARTGTELDRPLAEAATDPAATSSTSSTIASVSRPV